eukprot:c34545_g1_i1 orf=48-233(+)
MPTVANLLRLGVTDVYVKAITEAITEGLSEKLLEDLSPSLRKCPLDLLVLACLQCHEPRFN